MTAKEVEKVYKRVEVDQLTKNNLKQFRIIVEKAGKKSVLEGEKPDLKVEDSYDADSVEISDEIAKKWIGEECSKLGLFVVLCHDRLGSYGWTVGYVDTYGISNGIPIYNTRKQRI